MRNSTLGAKALSIRPPATITPLKMVTGRAPKFSTQALQMGPGGEETSVSGSTLQCKHLRGPGGGRRGGVVGVGAQGWGWQRRC